MPSTKEVPLASGIEVQRAALDAVLRSRTFAKNLRLSALLEYLCARCFHGETNAIKEYNIATDVFGRSPNFDQSQDAIVRVEMHRLRKKLAEFYAAEGQSEPVEIVIHSGHYTPEFVPRKVSALASSDPPSSAHRSDPPVIAERPAPWRSRRAWITWGGGALLIFGLLVVTAFLRPGGARRTQIPAAARSTSDLPIAGAYATEGIRILCGSAAASLRDRQGNLWGPDAFYSGGSTVSLPDRQIFRTRDSFLF